MSTLALGGTALGEGPILAPATPTAAPTTTFSPPRIIPPGGLPDVVGTPTLPGAGSPDVGFPVAPGDTGLLDALAGLVGEFEGMLGDHATTIQTAPQCAPTWTGEAATAYANLSFLVAAHFHHAAGTAADAKGALQRWSAELGRCQREGMVAVTEAEHWLAEIKTQQQALTTAQGDITTSQGAVTAAQANLALAASPGHTGAATAHLVQAVGTAQTALTQAQTAAQTARTKLDHAQHELAIWQARGRNAWQDAEHAAQTATGSLAPLFLTPPPLAGLPVPLSPTPPFAGPADPNCQGESNNTTANASSGLPDKLRSLAASIAGISPGLAGTLLALAKALEDGEAEEDGGLLAESEAAGGHAIERHVGLSDTDLNARVATQSNIPGASTFTDLTTAESAVKDVLTTDRSKIETWLLGGARKLVLDGQAPEAIGRYVARGSTDARDVSGVVVVLQRDPALAAGYRIQTAYPTP